MYNKIKDKTVEYVHTHDLKSHLPFHHHADADSKGSALENPPKNHSTQTTGPKNPPAGGSVSDKDVKVTGDKKETTERKKDGSLIKEKKQDTEIKKKDGSLIKEKKLDTETKKKDGSLIKEKKLDTETKKKDGSLIKKSKEHSNETGEHKKKGSLIKEKKHTEHHDGEHKKDGSLIRKSKETGETKKKDGSLIKNKEKKEETSEHKKSVSLITEKKHTEHHDGEHKKSGSLIKEKKKSGSLIKDEASASNVSIDLSASTRAAMNQEQADKGYIEIYAGPADSDEDLIRTINPALAPHLTHHGDINSPCPLHLPARPTTPIIEINDVVLDHRDFVEKEVPARPLSVYEQITPIQKTEVRVRELESSAKARKLQEEKTFDKSEKKNKSKETKAVQKNLEGVKADSGSHRTLQTIGTPDITLHHGADLPYKPRAMDVDVEKTETSSVDSKLKEGHVANKHLDAVRADSDSHRTLQTIGTPDITLHHGADLPYKPRAIDSDEKIKTEAIVAEHDKDHKLKDKTKIKEKTKNKDALHGHDRDRISAEVVREDNKHTLPTTHKAVKEGKVVKESIKEVELHKVQPVVHREREQKEIRHVVAPVNERIVKDTTVVHKEKDIDLGTRKAESTLEVSRPRGTAPVVESSKEYVAKEKQMQELPARVEEHVHCKVEEHVHPVIYKETLVPKVTEETHHIYEVVKEAPMETWTQTRSGDIDHSNSHFASAERAFFAEQMNRGIDLDVHSEHIHHAVAMTKDCKQTTKHDVVAMQPKSLESTAKFETATAGHHKNTADAALCDKCSHDANQICTHSGTGLQSSIITTTTTTTKQEGVMPGNSSKSSSLANPVQQV